MSSSFNYAASGALVALSLVACGAGPTEAERIPAPKVRQQVDADRNRVWLLTREGLAVFDAAAPDKVVQVKIPDWHFAGEPYGCLPALALGPKGEAVVSSDVVPVLWRIDPETLSVTRHEPRLDADADKDAGFTAIRYLPEQAAFLAVSGAHGTVWRIDRELRLAHKMVRQVPRAKGCQVQAYF